MRPTMFKLAVSLFITLTVTLAIAPTCRRAVARRPARSTNESFSRTENGVGISASKEPANIDPNRRAEVIRSYGKLPLSFEANEGQTNADVKFLSRGADRSLYLTSTEAVMTIGGPDRNQQSQRSAPDAAPNPPGLEKHESRSSVLRMKFIGANASAKVTGIDELSSRSNYFIGNDPKNWRVNVSNYGTVKYEQLYRGVDLVYYGNNRQLEYDLIVAPRANPGAIRLSFEGAEKMELEGAGDLVLLTPGGETRLHKPVVYQTVNGFRKEVPADYVKQSGNEIGFQLGEYDPDVSLVIDPVLSYSTYLGGSFFDSVSAISVDSAGNACITGTTASIDFPTHNPIQPNEHPIFDAFVTKLNPTGTGLVYSTYIGGSKADQGNAIAVDSAGSVYVAGQTDSTDFPLANAFQSIHAGSPSDAFVLKLNATGNVLAYATYLGGSQQDIARGIAVDSTGNAYIGGETVSPNFPVMNPWQSHGGGFLTKLSSSGSSLVYSTYFGSPIGPVAVDGTGAAYIAGSTFALNLPLVNAVQQNLKGGNLFKSDDGAENWSAINNGVVINQNCTTIAVDPIVPTTLYAGIRGAGIVKSTDSGGSWNAVNNISSTFGVTQVVIDPRSTSTVYSVDGNNGLSRSTDGGINWDLINFFGPFTSFAIDPVNSLNLYSPGGQSVSKSTDGGTTWEKVLVSDTIFHFIARNLASLSIDPHVPSTLYASDVGGVFKSLDGGSHWRRLPLEFTSPAGVAIDPVTTSTLYAWSSPGGIHKSTDSGQTWFAVNTGLQQNVSTVVIDPIDPSVLYAGTLTGTYKSTDGGSSWNSGRSRLTNQSVTTLAIDPQDTSNLYAGTRASSDCFVAKFNSAGSDLLYSTYLGGDASDGTAGLAVDAAGNAYVTGSTYSLNFPTKNPLRGFSGYLDAFVTKLSTSHPEIIYSTYLGGTGYDAGFDLGIDSLGNAYITGQTFSTDFPLVSPLQTQGFSFVARVNPLGTGLAYSTLLSETDYGAAIAVDPSGNAYVAGGTSSNSFLTTPGAFQRSKLGTGGQQTTYVVKISEFDSCLQDDSSGGTLRFNTTSGDYQFLDCHGFTLNGIASITRRGCLITLQVNGPDRRLQASIDTCRNTATASIQIFSQGRTFTLQDRNTANNTCVCAGH